jgi:hypothetical protein
VVVVVVASQGLLLICLNKGIEQVAKLEHANASSKLQHGPVPCSNLLATALHHILDGSCIHCSKIGVFHYSYKALEYALLNRITKLNLI